MYVNQYMNIYGMVNLLWFTGLQFITVVEATILTVCFYNIEMPFTQWKASADTYMHFVNWYFGVFLNAVVKVTIEKNKFELLFFKNMNTC